MLAHCLLAITLLVLGTGVAVLGAPLTAPAITVGGVAVIVLGTWLLRPIAPVVLNWLDEKGA